MQSVDVIIPCYNGEAFVTRAIKSLLSQTHKIENILVINDGSTDGTVDLIEELALLNPSIRLISQENLGLSAARNLGLSMAKSDFVAFLDADDAWLPRKIENQLMALNRQPDCIGVVSQFMYSSDFEIFEFGHTPKKEITSLNLLRRRCFLPGSASSLLIRATPTTRNVFFDTSLPYAEDLDYAIRLLDIGEIVVCKDRDVQIFVSPSGIQSKVLTNPNPAVSSLLSILEKNRWRVSTLEFGFLSIDIFWQFIYQNLRVGKLDGLRLLNLREVSFISKTSYLSNLFMAILSLPIGPVRTLMRNFSM